jgi:hypothetical protein
MPFIDMFTHTTNILNTNSHPAAELRGIHSIKLHLPAFFPFVNSLSIIKPVTNFHVLKED